MEKRENKMAAMPMKKLLFTMAVPLMVSLLVQSLYNIVDSMFVAGYSEDALTATTLVYAVQFLMIPIVGYNYGAGLGNGLINMIGTALRQLIILIPLMLILAKHAGLPYVWFAFWVSELFAFLYSIYAVRREKNRKLAKFHTL